MKSPKGALDIVLRLLVAGALAIDATVHLQLAAYYQLAVPAGIGQGTLFRIEATIAILVGLYVLVRGSRPAYAAAVIVAGGGVFLVLLYRYVNVPAFGPVPAMYEPVWYFQKSLSAIAEAAGAVLALLGLLKPRPHGGHG
ncbi:hypothetical protein [Arthrobacter sp. STN4]|uniref:hypothetical protein n=1 Tax=Arthrobacter sp. STN4 TaxID=2923276 RepID=UPI00211A2B67|nr:hypothetical protein [Arthrobacter sp. STN4]MCQ9164236.1 hypothetical protein [Arthrobacter sp. STN4]